MHLSHSDVPSGAFLRWHVAGGIAPRKTLHSGRGSLPPIVCEADPLISAKLTTMAHFRLLAGHQSAGTTEKSYAGMRALACRCRTNSLPVGRSPTQSALNQRARRIGRSACRARSAPPERSRLAGFVLSSRNATPFWETAPPSRAVSGNGSGWGVKLQTHSNFHIVWSFGPDGSASFGMSFRRRNFSACYARSRPRATKEIGLSSESFSFAARGGRGGWSVCAGQTRAAT